MRTLVRNDHTKCVGCNKCLRVCPVEEANRTVMEGNVAKVALDSAKCISCGACIAACKHGSRYYEDDTERFFSDLRSGASISMFAAPALRVNYPGWKRLLTFLRRSGVKKIYDVSLGADICTWAHIRYIQKYSPGPLITQPCPAIVSYILMHKPELASKLSPVHSPMLCTAVYMRKHENVTGKIAAISPCIAKAEEFEDTGLVDYNVTIKNLLGYIESHGITMPMDESGFDHYESALGGLYSMPGGLKENVEFFLGKALRIDKAEGQASVYKALDLYADTPQEHLPAIFDVLNCPEGCNIGTGCSHEKNIFTVNAGMEAVRGRAVSGREQEYFDELYDTYDKTLNLQDYVRTYRPRFVEPIRVTSMDIEKAFTAMGKKDEAARKFDCGACGCLSCKDMARKIAKGLDTPNHCALRERSLLADEMGEMLEFCTENNANTKKVRHRLQEIQSSAEQMAHDVERITASMNGYSQMVREINHISTQIYMISVNASIEAARAGIHGKAFTVVAEEIQNLSRSTKKSLDGTTQSSIASREALSDMTEDFGKIAEAVAESFEDVHKIYETTQKFLDDIHEVQS